MTRAEFENINDWYDLKQFCYDIGCEYCDDVLDSDELDQRIEDDLDDAIRYQSYSWRNVRDALDEISTGYDYYIVNGSFDYEVANEYDFDRYKDDVREYAERYDHFDDDEGEEDCDAPSVYPGRAILPEDMGEAEQENIPITDLFTTVEVVETEVSCDLSTLYETSAAS